MVTDDDLSRWKRTVADISSSQGQRIDAANAWYTFCLSSQRLKEGAVKADVGIALLESSMAGLIELNHQMLVRLGTGLKELLYDDAAKSMMMPFLNRNSDLGNGNSELVLCFKIDEIIGRLIDRPAKARDGEFQSSTFGRGVPGVSARRAKARL